jgi:hypothetical protein
MGEPMKRILLAALLLCLALATPALAADNSRFYGLWEVKGKIGSTTIDPFLYAVGDRPYNTGGGDALYTGQTVFPAEYVKDGNYYYSQLNRTGTHFSNSALFVDNGWASGHPGWIVEGSVYVNIAGNNVVFDAYLNDPPITNMYKSAHFTVHVNDSLNQASIDGMYYDYTSRNWRFNIEASMEKIGSYQDGKFIHF